jgi:hypothetical protein
MLTTGYAVGNAATESQILRRLSSFLEYLRSCHVDSVLPRRFSGLSASSPDAVRDWAKKLCEGGTDSYRLSAAGYCWLEEVRGAFSAAARRLDEIAAPRQQPAGRRERIIRPETGSPDVRG